MFVGLLLIAMIGWAIWMALGATEEGCLQVIFFCCIAGGLYILWELHHY